ncbi:unnamed protein product [Calypogeia fissa]
MGWVGRWWGNAQYSLSGCYLLASTVLVMSVVFTAQEFLFPRAAYCHSCSESQSDQVGLLYATLNVGKTAGPLVVQNRMQQNSVALESVQEGDLKTLKTSPSTWVNAVQEAEILKVSEVNLPDVDVEVEVLSEADLPGKVVTRLAKPTPDQHIAPAPPRPFVSSVWYYTKVYKHPVAQLRELTAEDGAPLIESNIPPPEREITIVTQTSADRLPALEATCLTWGGAIVVAVHVRLQSEIATVYDQVKQMHVRVEERPGSCRMDVQLVTEDGFESEEEALRALYPVNALRNVALGMAKTQLVFLLDADFKPSPRLHEILTEDEEKYEDLLRQATQERQLFVVPAFEAAGVNGHRKEKVNVTVPETMEDLRDSWEKKTIDCFHCRKSPTGHMPTIFKKFFNPNTSSPYPISYRDGFEPYVIGALDAIPPYDGRFRGYGENKVSHIYSCAADGMGFQVLPNAFVFELPHHPSKAYDTYIGKNRDPDQRYRIVGLYNQFKHEIGKMQEEKDPDRYAHFLRTARQG